jgi:hypothetical protein
LVMPAQAGIQSSPRAQRLNLAPMPLVEEDSGGG